MKEGTQSCRCSSLLVEFGQLLSASLFHLIYCPLSGSLSQPGIVCMTCWPAVTCALRTLLCTGRAVPRGFNVTRRQRHLSYTLLVVGRQFMAAERTHVTDRQPLGDAVRVELVHARWTWHHGDLHTIHKLLKAYATVGNCGGMTLDTRKAPRGPSR